jgi:hypothetical protein
MSKDFFTHGYNKETEEIRNLKRKVEKLEAHIKFIYDWTMEHSSKHVIEEGRNDKK